MSRSKSTKANVQPRWVRALAAFARQISRRLIALVHHGSVPIRVLVSDPTQRKAIRSEVNRTWSQLASVLGGLAPRDVVIVVQPIAWSGGQVAGCCEPTRGTGGRRIALIRLALQARDRILSLDEVLSVLAELAINLAITGDEVPLVIVPMPIDLEREPAVLANEAPVRLPPDPLAPSANGQHTHIPAA